jgi:hypothetical protein
MPIAATQNCDSAGAISVHTTVRSIARYREWMVRDLVIDIEAHSCIVGRVFKKPVLVPFPAAAMRASDFFCLCSCVRRQPWAAFKLVVKAALIDERAIDYFVNDRLLAFDEYGPNSRLRKVTA